jgi:hypothetical protein
MRILELWAESASKETVNLFNATKVWRLKMNREESQMRCLSLFDFKLPRNEASIHLSGFELSFK